MYDKLAEYHLLSPHNGRFAASGFYFRLFAAKMKFSEDSGLRAPRIEKAILFFAPVPLCAAHFVSPDKY